jgi:hypothetical protein
MLLGFHTYSFSVPDRCIDQYCVRYPELYNVRDVGGRLLGVLFTFANNRFSFLPTGKTSALKASSLDDLFSKIYAFHKD